APSMGRPFKPVTAFAVPVLWVAWAFLTRGGLTFPLSGLALVRADGRPAARWQCAWRALLVWAPVLALLSLAYCLGLQFPDSLEQDALSWGGRAIVGVVLPAGGLLLVAPLPAALWPGRSAHARLAGTYVVPR